MLPGTHTTRMACAIAALTLSAVLLTTSPASGGDPFLDRAVRQMEDRPTAPPDRPAKDEQPDQDDAAPAQDARDRRAAARDQLRQQRADRALEKAAAAQAKLGPARAEARRLIDRAQYHDAYRLLRKAAGSIDPLHDPALQAMLGELALIDHKPDKALDLLAPVLPAPDPAIGRLDPRTLTEEELAPLIGPLMIAGRAYSALAIDQSRAAARADAVDDDNAWPPRETPDRREHENTFFGIPIEPGENPEPTSADELAAMLGLASRLPDLDFLGVPIDAATDKPALTPEARRHADQALRVFDHLAGHTEGSTRVEAAWRCGRSLALLGRYDEALGAFKFAAQALRFEHSAELPAHLKPLANAIARDRKRVEYLRDVLRYGLEYILFRRAQQHRLAGRHAEAAAGYRRCIASAQQTMGRLLLDQLSTDLNTLSRDAARNKQPDESPYTSAARLYEALCLIELGEAKRAVELLHAFVDEDPATVLPTPAQQAELDRTLLEDRVPGSGPAAPLLYRGEALRELGRLALEHELDLDRAEGYFARLDHWLTRARADSSGWDFSAKLPGIKAAAKRRTDGPRAEYHKPDFWGNVKESKIDPGMLVNRKTTPWYLDDLEEDCAKFRGFVHFARGESQDAKRHFERLVALDPATQALEETNQPNTLRRLMFGVEHGYLYAQPDELALYPAKLRSVVMLADVLYVSEAYEDAARLYTALLGDQYGKLTSAQRDYPIYARAWCVYRGQITEQHEVIDRVVDELERVIETRDRTLTEYRAAYMITRFVKHHSDPERRVRRRQLLKMLAEADADNPWRWKGRINLALDLVRSPHAADQNRGLSMLKNFPRSSGDYYELAQFYYRENTTP